MREGASMKGGEKRGGRDEHERWGEERGEG